MARWLLILISLTLAAFLPAQADENITPVLTLEQPSPHKPPQAGLIQAPSFDRSEPALAYFKLQNNWREDAHSDYVTFGQAFAMGALRPGEAISARYGEATLPVQIDIKALHEDGSVRHAVVTLVTPLVENGETVDGALIIKKSVAHEGQQDPFDAKAIVTEKFVAPVTLTLYFANGTQEVVDADVRGAALHALQQTEQDVWLNGVFVKERRFQMEAAPHLDLRFDLRIYRDGDIRLSAAFISEKSFAPGRRDSVYDVSIGGAFSAEKVPHHRAANWRRVFWIGDQPRAHVIHDVEGLAAAGAILPIDASLGVEAAGIAERDALLRDLPPLSPALIERYMPAPGGRPDIGPYPQWTSHYLAVQTEAAKRVMLANADAAGAVPWHYADDHTGAPISIEDYPKFWADERGLQAHYGRDRPHPDVFASSDGGWTPDHSHKPALTAVPYLVTGDRYYADELAMQAAWAIFGRWPDLRKGGVKAIDVEQVRASAWSLRDLSDAAFLLPDAHPSKAYLSRALEENLRLAKEKYVDARAMRSAGALEGFFAELIEREPERISPWQNDYMAISLWLAARRGDDNADALLGWSANFHAQRFLNTALPIPWGASYQLPAKDARTQQPVADWAALAAKMRMQGLFAGEAETYPQLGHGYIGSAHAALTAAASQTGAPSALEALALMLRETRRYALWARLSKDGVYRNNNFLFELTAPNGARYGRNDIRWSGKADDDGGVVIGADKDDRLNGAEGPDILFGLSGDDAINAGPGADYISGGPGDDVLTGGGGADIFAFSNIDNGVDRITDFDPLEDQIRIDFETKIDVIDSRDGARIAFDDGRGAVVFLNIRANSLIGKSFIKND